MATNSTDTLEKAPRDLNGLFGAFYEKFLLRDYFGKVIPGFMALAAVSTLLTSPKGTIEYLSSMSFGAWFIALGIAWIAGVAIQSFGDTSGLILYYRKPKAEIAVLSRCIAKKEIEQFYVQKEFVKTSDGKVIGPITETDSDFYTFWTLFDQCTTKLPEKKQQRERYVVLKEACGNTYVALIFVFLIIVLRDLINISDIEGLKDVAVLASELGAVAFGSYTLCRMHFIHVRRQDEMMFRTIIQLSGSSKKKGPSRAR